MKDLKNALDNWAMMTSNLINKNIFTKYLNRLNEPP